MTPWDKAKQLGPIAATTTGLGLGVAASNVATNITAQNSGGGPEVTWMALLANGVGQGVKNIPWVDEHKWLVPVLFTFTWILAFLLFADHIRALADATLATGQAVANYWGQSVSATPNLLPPTKAPYEQFRLRQETISG